jgi:hypothetical protein
MDKAIIRHGEPSKYDHAPYGTLCKMVNIHYDDFTIYVQSNYDESNPNWKLVGVFTSENAHVARDQANNLMLQRE